MFGRIVCCCYRSVGEIFNPSLSLTFFETFKMLKKCSTKIVYILLIHSSSMVCVVFVHIAVYGW